MAHAKRNGSSNGHALKIVKANGKGHGPKVSSFREIFTKIFDALLTADVEDELAYAHAGTIARDVLSQSICPIVSTGSGNYDGRTMNGATTKTRNGTAKKTPLDDPFHVVIARGIARFIERQDLSFAGADKKYGFSTRYTYRLVKETTPGLIGENIDKVCQAFGITRRELEDLGTPPT